MGNSLSPKEAHPCDYRKIKCYYLYVRVRVHRYRFILLILSYPIKLSYAVAKCNISLSDLFSPQPPEKKFNYKPTGLAPSET